MKKKTGSAVSGGKKMQEEKKGTTPRSKRQKIATGDSNSNEKRKDIQKYADQMLKILNQRPSSVYQLSKDLDIAPQFVFRVIQELNSRGYRIVRDSFGDIRIASVFQFDPGSSYEVKWRPTTRVLAWAGSEFGSIGQQADLVKTVYKTIIPEEKPDFVIALGNVIQGNLSASRKNETFLTEQPDFYDQPTASRKKVNFTELLYRGQIKYVQKIGQDVLTTPHECSTHFISGLRESSFIKKGLSDPLLEICEGRNKNKWVYGARNMKVFPVINTGEPVNIFALTSKKNPFRGVYTRGYRPRKTADAIAGWLINTLRTIGVKSYPHIVLWTDGVGMYTSLHNIGDFHFISLPKLSVTDPTELELDTPPNLGVVIIDITFDSNGKLKKHGIECKFRNLAPYITTRGY